MPSEWGRVAEDGTVYVRTAGGERPVGSFAGPPEEALAFYVGRYDALAGEVAVIEQRLAVPTADPRAIADSARKRLAVLDEAAAVGDIEAVRHRLESVIASADARLEEKRAARARHREEVTAAKRALVEEAEQLAASTEWKKSGDRLRAIVEEWSGLRGGDRSAEQELWRRLSAARREFAHRRGAHFSELEDKRREARACKEQLAAEAESLVESSSWKETSEKFRDLMNKWKAAGPAGKEADAQLWARFSAAREAFSSRRAAVNVERDAELKANLEAKRELVGRAESIDTTDVEGARRALRDVQDKWRTIGPVPRENRGELEGRLGAVEARIREVVEQRWREPRLGSSPLLVRLRESVAKLEARVERARAAGDDSTLREAEAALATQRDWLVQAERSAT